MPFLQVNVEQEIQKQRENDPEFKKMDVFGGAE